MEEAIEGGASTHIAEKPSAFAGRPGGPGFFFFLLGAVLPGGRQCLRFGCEVCRWYGVGCVNRGVRWEEEVAA